jgi:3',5'-cyclic AMP phosphodiesterase CpdA
MGENSTFTFMQLADPQFGLFAHYSGRTADEASELRARGLPVRAQPRFEHWDEEKRLLKLAIAKANSLRPAFVVVCGDMVMKHDNEAQREDLLKIAGELDPGLPVYWVAGNHDVGVDYYTPTRESLAAYRKHFGRDYYSFTYGNSRFITINSPLLDRPEGSPTDYEDQQAWLQVQLAAARHGETDHTVLFSHHPPFLQHAEEPDEVWNIPIARRRPLLDMLSEAGVSAVFAGHTHENVYARHGAMEIVASAAVGFNRMGNRSGYRLVTVSPSAIEHRYFPLESG